MKIKLYFRDDLHPTIDTRYEEFLIALEGPSNFIQVGAVSGKQHGFNKAHLIYWEVLQ